MASQMEPSSTTKPPLLLVKTSEDGRDVPSPLVSLLLTHRADVHAADARGKTPLMHVGKAQHDTIGFLGKFGEDI